MRLNNTAIPVSFAHELERELTGNILPFWLSHGRDEAARGFYGVLGNDNAVVATAPCSVVMTARHLWTYSAAARFPKTCGLRSISGNWGEKKFLLAAWHGGIGEVAYAEAWPFDIGRRQQS
jgi:hypothetical protein